MTTLLPGTRVCLHFTLRLSDGTEVDSTVGGEPWCFDLGDGSMPEGMEQALGLLAPKQRESIVVGPADAYGFPDETLIQSVPVTDFPPDMELAEGIAIAFATPSGDELPGVVRALQGDTVLVDFNHPLAGHTVIFEVELVSVETAGPKQD